MKKLSTLILFFMMFSCSSPDISSYKGTSPKMNLQEFFNGKIEGYGFFQNRQGKIEKRYYVEMTGSWQGNQGILEEKFYLDDGSKMNRKWTLTAIDENNFSGTASDIEGVAIGKIEGYAMQLKYTLKYDQGNGKTINLNFDDWIYLMPDGSAINRSKMSKFGIGLGEIMFNFKKLNTNEKFKGQF